MRSLLLAALLVAPAQATPIYLDFPAVTTNLKSVVGGSGQFDWYQTEVDIDATFDMGTATLDLHRLTYYTLPALDGTREVVLDFEPTAAVLPELDRLRNHYFEGPVDLVDQFGNADTMTFRVARLDRDGGGVHDSILSYGGERLHLVQFDPFAPGRGVWQLSQFTASVPEPSSLVLLGVAVAVCQRTGRGNKNG